MQTIPKALIPYILTDTYNWFHLQLKSWSNVITEFANDHDLAEVSLPEDSTPLLYDDIAGTIGILFFAADLNESDLYCGLKEIQSKIDNRKDLNSYFFIHMHLLGHALFIDTFEEHYDPDSLEDKAICEQSCLNFAALMTYYHLPIKVLSPLSARDILASMSDTSYLVEKGKIEDQSMQVWNATIHLCQAFFQLPIELH